MKLVKPCNSRDNNNISVRGRHEGSLGFSYVPAATVLIIFAILYYYVYNITYDMILFWRGDVIVATANSPLTHSLSLAHILFLILFLFLSIWVSRPRARYGNFPITASVRPRASVYNIMYSVIRISCNENCYGDNENVFNIISIIYVTKYYDHPVCA